MCARYTLKTSATVLAELFDLDEVPDLAPRYNIAPTQAVPGVVERGGRRELRMFRWGLIPSWAKDMSIGQKLINARAETLAEKPSFRSAFKRRRCLLPADGFFEWTEVDPAQPDPNLGLAGRSLPSAKPYKQPFHIRLRSGEPFAFAGLFEVWDTPEAGPLETCAIITTEPNELLGKVHNRMPAILAREDYGPWLNNEAQSPDPLLPLLAPYPADPMEMVPVTRLMSNPRFDDPVCVAPLV